MLDHFTSHNVCQTFSHEGIGFCQRNCNWFTSACYSFITHNTNNSFSCIVYTVNTGNCVQVYCLTSLEKKRRRKYWLMILNTGYLTCDRYEHEWVCWALLSYVCSHICNTCVLRYESRYIFNFVENSSLHFHRLRIHYSATNWLRFPNTVYNLCASASIYFTKCFTFHVSCSCMLIKWNNTS